MALTTLAFRPRDFSGNHMGLASEIYFHPMQMGTGKSGNWVLIDRPIRADMSQPEGSEPFTVELHENYAYRMEVLWHDSDRSRVGRSEWFAPFRVPPSGDSEQINLREILGLPPRNGMIRVLQSDPSPSSIFDQYVYNEETGDLFERSTN